MSEQLILSPNSNPEESKQNKRWTEFESPSEQYNQLNDLRLGYEEDASSVHNALLKIMWNSTEDNQDEARQAKINKLKTYLELDERTLADLELKMTELEYELGYGPNRSKRFDNLKNDMLVCSAVFFNERINNLREATNNPDIDKPLVQAVIDYAVATQNGEIAFVCASLHESSKMEENRENSQMHRSICHNNMINELNKLNELARKCGVKPLLYRNLIKNSATNDYKNDAQMYHDRVTASSYMVEVVWLGGDERFPDPKYIE